MKNQALVAWFMLLLLMTLSGQQGRANTPPARTVTLPLYDVLNLMEGPLFNRISIFLDDYSGNGKAGAPSYVKFGDKTISEFYLPHVENPSNRWHIQNIASKGIDLRVDAANPKKVVLFFDFETGDREIICITRVSKNIDKVLSGDIHQPQMEVAMTLKNEGNSISYNVDKATWKGKVDIKVTIFGLIDKLINKMAKPKIEANIKNTLNSSEMKKRFRTALDNAIKSTDKFQQQVKKFGLKTVTIAGLKIDGKNLVVTFQ